MNQIGINSKSGSVFFSIFAALVLLIIPASSQTRRPTPTPRSQVPEVVSRDSTDNQNPVVTRREDVRESSPRDDSTDISLEAGGAPARTEALPYSIKLSEAQQKMMLFLDILSKTEARAELLRARLFEMIEKENQLQAQIRDIEFSLRPDQIQNSAALVGSLRPEDVRTARERMLLASKASAEALLDQIVRNRSSVENSLLAADSLVERVRLKFEAFIDKALEDEEEY